MGNVYMEADQVRFKDSTYRNVQEGLAAALEGGGGGGTTVVANPEGSATADLAKLKVGDTIYGIPETAAKVTYDNTSSGLTADDVQEAIDELNTGLSGVTELIPSGATSSNKLATASDIPDAVIGNPSGSATAGNLTKLQIGSDIYDVPSGGGGSAQELGSVTFNKSDFVVDGTNNSADSLFTANESNAMKDANLICVYAYVKSSTDKDILLGSETFSLKTISNTARQMTIANWGSSNPYATIDNLRVLFFQYESGENGRLVAQFIIKNDIFSGFASDSVFGLKVVKIA